MADQLPPPTLSRAPAVRRRQGGGGEAERISGTFVEDASPSAAVDDSPLPLSSSPINAGSFRDPLSSVEPDGPSQEDPKGEEGNAGAPVHVPDALSSESRWAYQVAKDAEKKPPGRIVETVNRLGEKFINAIDEGLTSIENNIIQGTAMTQIIRKSHIFSLQNSSSESAVALAHPNITVEEIQLKAARDVANAMTVKVKLLLRELKTVKQELESTNVRCSQLEAENRILRDADPTGGHREDDDLIRLQLETLLKEKAALALENAAYARENRFLHEIVEYHQLAAQSIISLDYENMEVLYADPAAKLDLAGMLGEEARQEEDAPRSQQRD